MNSIFHFAISTHTAAQLVQIVGALFCLIAFAAAQFRWSATDSPLYLGLNLAGSSVLAVLALYEKQWGFLLLEGCWAIISLGSVVLKISRSKKASSGESSDSIPDSKPGSEPVFHL